jgi:UDP-2,3-diacylglucosamine hydrolase
MSYTLFMSDMHLDPSRPDISALFIDYLQQHGPQADAIYLLGDLFEVWLGDKTSLPDYADVIRCFANLAPTTPIYVLRGNRDFTLGKQFAAASGTQLLGDPHIIDLYGVSTLISHGDLLCTDDIDYQRYRTIANNPLVKWLALTLIPDSRKRDIAKNMREASKKAQAEKQSEIMDVNHDAVISWFRQYRVQQIIHGHTHRPKQHHYEVDGDNKQRWVLGDWYSQGSVLRVDSNNGAELLQLSLAQD